MDYLDSLKTTRPDLQDKLELMSDLFARRLWHQLTETVLHFVSDPSRAPQDGFVDLYERFITKFEGRLNQVRFAQIVSHIGNGLEPSRGIEFFNHVLRNRTRMGVEAALCVDLDIAVLKLQLGMLDEAKSTLEQARVLLDGMADSGVVVHSKYYRAASEYHKLAGPPEKFYHDSLMYISYTPLSEFTDAQRFALATDICLAALTGDGIYNFGEVLGTPILSALDKSENAWLKQLVMVFDRGDIEGFNKVVESNYEKYFAQPALASRNEMVKQKLVLMALMDMVFQKPPHDRNLTFDAIAERTRLPRDQVEYVLMRAMSAGVITANLDEVEGVARVSWVQPRVLGREQLVELRDRMTAWHGKVKEALIFMEGETPELLV